jgi:broad specificity phosphatase PhoE
VNLVYLVRHGENPANITKEFSYRKVDYPLTPKGVLQAQQTAVYFRARDVDAIYSSPLKRARQTAEIIGEAVGLPVTLLEQFREINVGSLEDQPPTRENWAIHDAVLRQWRAGHHSATFPDGEDFNALLGRAYAGLAAALRGRTGQRVVIVGHGGIFTAATAALCADSVREVISRPSHNCSITTLEIEGEADAWRGTLLEWASYAHLSGEAAEMVSATPTGVLPDAVREDAQR